VDRELGRGAGAVVVDEDHDVAQLLAVAHAHVAAELGEPGLAAADVALVDVMLDIVADERQHLLGVACVEGGVIGFDDLAGRHAVFSVEGFSLGGPKRSSIRARIWSRVWR
jgi:hypothetical protein